MILDWLFRASGGARVLTSADLAEALRAGSDSAAGVSVTETRAMQYAAVFACVRVLAETVGQLPLHLYHQPEGEREKEKATDHPLYGLLKYAPNRTTTAQETKEFWVANAALRGNAYSQIVRSNPGAGRASRRVLELLPFNSGSVTPKQGANREVTFEVHQSDGKLDTLPFEEVLHIPLFRLSASDLAGLSPVAYARETVGMAIAAEQFGGSLFRNGAVPGGMLTHPGKLSPDARKNLKESWDAQHAGSGNAGKIAVLDEGMTFKEVGFPAKDAQFLETRKYQRTEVAGLFRVPPHMIGDLERATFANIEEQGLEFVVHGLMPYLTRIEQRIALQLLTAEERLEFFARFNVAGLLRGNSAARAALYQALFSVGAASPNDIRELEDMNPRKGGDEYLTPANMLSDAQRQAAPSSAPASPADGPEETEADAAVDRLIRKVSAIGDRLTEGGKAVRAQPETP